MKTTRRYIFRPRKYEAESEDSMSQVISLEIPAEMVTRGSTAWGDDPSAKRMRNWQEAARSSIEGWPHRQRLLDWFQARTRLALIVDFYLGCRPDCGKNIL
jgi:hypothetical protein